MTACTKHDFAPFESGIQDAVCEPAAPVIPMACCVITFGELWHLLVINSLLRGKGWFENPMWNWL